MSAFFNNLKADLLDRRLAPLLALAAAALVAAIAYAVLSGGSSTPAPATVPAIAATLPSAGIAATQTTPEKAVAEITSGSSEQRHGAARDPFALLPEAAAVAAAAKKAAAISVSANPTGTGTSTSGSPGKGTASEPAKTESGTSGSEKSTTTPTAPAKPSKPKTIYHVAILFGVIPPGVTAANASLTPFESLKLLSPLPSAQQSLLVFRGVTAGGKSATFTLVSEAILHGSANCLPSASQCQAIDLAPGQTEQLEYIGPSGEVSLYELRIVSIVSAKASTAAVKNLLRSQSKAGSELLHEDGLTAIPDLHASSQAGVLVFASHGARAAHAHAAARAHR